MAQLGRRRCLYVLPFVGAVAAKAAHLKHVLRPLGQRIISLAGTQKCGRRQTEADIVVCTVEKANCFVNRLLAEGRLGELGLLVIDEAHMIGEPERGGLLEAMLTKIRYSAVGVQVVAMSATLPGATTLADWLGAQLYVSAFRPVPVDYYVSQRGLVFRASDGTFQRALGPPPPPVPLEMHQTPRQAAAAAAAAAAAVVNDYTVPLGARGARSAAQRQVAVQQQLNAMGTPPVGSAVPAPQMPEKDPDGLLFLVREVTVHRQRALIYCATKRRSEQVAQHLATMLLDAAPARPPGNTGPLPTIEGPLGTELYAHRDDDDDDIEGPHGPNLAARRSELMAQLSRLPTGLDPQLGALIPHGIAFHHAGLTSDERELLERAFREVWPPAPLPALSLDAGLHRRAWHAA